MSLKRDRDYECEQSSKKQRVYVPAQDEEDVIYICTQEPNVLKTYSHAESFNNTRNDDIDYSLHPHSRENAKLGGRMYKIAHEYKNRLLCIGVTTLQDRQKKYEDVRCNIPSSVGICTKCFPQIITSKHAYGENYKNLKLWYKALKEWDVSLIIHSLNVFGKLIYEDSISKGNPPLLMENINRSIE